MKPQTTSKAARMNPAATWNACGATIDGPHSRQGKVHDSAKTMVVTASQRHSAAKESPHAGAEQPGLDRIADHEEAAERQRQPADPDHPAGADALLEARAGLRYGCRWWNVRYRRRRYRLDRRRRCCCFGS